MSDRMGIILPDVYDGVSVWIEPDGTYTNRWDPDTYPRRWRAAQEWIDAREMETI